MSRAALICATALALLLGAGAAHAASVPPNVAHCISGVQKLARQAERIVRAQKSYLPRDFYRMSDGVYHCQEYKEEHILAYMRECIRTLRKSSRADCGTLSEYASRFAVPLPEPRPVEAGLREDDRLEAEGLIPEIPLPRPRPIAATDRRYDLLCGDMRVTAWFTPKGIEMQFVDPEQAKLVNRATIKEGHLYLNDKLCVTVKPVPCEEQQECQHIDPKARQWTLKFFP
jgi:hypothetical protein